jgi:hypothetical protein
VRAPHKPVPPPLRHDHSGLVTIMTIVTTFGTFVMRDNEPRDLVEFHFGKLVFFFFLSFFFFPFFLSYGLVVFLFFSFLFFLSLCLVVFPFSFFFLFRFSLSPFFLVVSFFAFFAFLLFF